MPGIADLLREKMSPEAPDAPEATETEAAPELDLTAAEPSDEDESTELVDQPENDGKPKTIPYTRFTEVNARKKAAEARVAELEGKLKGSDKLSETFEELYSGMSDGIAQMKDDAAWASAAWDLRENPDVAKALRIIQQYHAGKKMPDRATQSQPTNDPRVDALFKERLGERAESILERARVRPELRPIIKAYVLEQNPAAQEEAVFNVIKEFVAANKWDQSFLRGAAQQKKRTSPPNPTGRGASLPAEKKNEKPKNLSEVQRGNRQRLRDLIGQAQSAHRG